MIKPYYETNRIAARERANARCSDAFYVREALDRLFGDRDHVADVVATELWFHNRQLACRPADIVEDELEHGGVYTSDPFK